MEFVTICGSMRFFYHMLTVAADETYAGNIVLMPFAVVAAEDQDGKIKAKLDELHREKINYSDRIIVVSDETGYYGESTLREIQYAGSRNMKIDYRKLKDGQV